MNKKGQALVEFVLILPVFLLILFTVVDFGNLLVSKNQLESASNDISRVILNGDSIQQVNSSYSEYNVTVLDYQDKYQKIVVTKEIRIITPFLDRILGNPCVVKVERVIPVVRDNGGGSNEEP